MLKLKWTVCLGVFLCLSMAVVSSIESADCFKDQAIVTFLKGKASLLHKGEEKAIRLRVRDSINQGDTVTTGKKTLIEIELPDGSFIRFADNTKFTIDDLIYNRQGKDRNFKFKLLLGRTWANAKELLGRKKRFEIASETAVAGIKGTTFRMNVQKDKSALIKVYKGDVYVANPPMVAPKSDGKIGAPEEIPGPAEVLGPREVTLKEWQYIVKEMQQITITSEGEALKPIYFSPEADMNDWVLWNKKRDTLIR